jgi:hypothetical protein
MVQDESCPCPQGAAEDPCCAQDPCLKNGVVSLCDVREKQIAQGRTERLLSLLCDIHSLGIRVHNEVIERSQVSVLSELCRAAGIYFDLAGEELRTSVLTPSALYGCSREKIYGKEPLQKRIGRSIFEDEHRRIWQQLSTQPVQLWCYHGRAASSFDDAHLLLGPERNQVRHFAGIIARSGEVKRNTGHYLGWTLEFEGVDYLVFGYALSLTSVQRIQTLAPQIASQGTRHYGERLELALIRAAVDPLDRHHRSTSTGTSLSLSTSTSAYRPGRRWLLRKIWSRIQQEFARPRCKLSLRAHIATVFADDARGIADYFTAIDQLREDVLLQFGPGRPGEAEISLDDVLSIYHLTREGAMDTVIGIDEHPVAVLLLEQPLLDALDVDRLTPIRDVLARVRAGQNTKASDAVEAAWFTYQLERHWLGTFGLGLDHPQAADPRTWPDDERPQLLHDMRSLFDARFFELTLDDMPIAPPDRARLRRAINASPLAADPIYIGSLPDDDHALLHLEGVGQKTFTKFQTALLEAGLSWRWLTTGLDPRAFSRTRHGDELADLKAGLDELADLFD